MKHSTNKNIQSYEALRTEQSRWIVIEVLADTITHSCGSGRTNSLEATENVISFAWIPPSSPRYMTLSLKQFKTW